MLYQQYLENKPIFDTMDTSIDIINYEKNKKFNSELSIIGSYIKKTGLDLKKIDLISKDNKLIINKFK